MSTNVPASVPSKPPIPEYPGIWREHLLTLAARSNLAVVYEENPDKQGFWWSTYHLINGSKREHLGTQSGTSIDIAREYAARQSYGTLATLINTWIQTAYTSAAASTSQAISTSSLPSTGQGSPWVQNLKRLAKEKQLRFECEQLQNPPGTHWAIYYLINPDGSRSYQLGRGSATNSNIAIDHAAHEAVETLTRWIATWPGTVAGPSGSGSSSG